MRTKITIARTIKRVFFRWRLHRFFPGKKASFVGHLSDLSRWISQQNGLKLTDFPTNRFVYTKRTELHEFLVNEENLNGPIDYFEFGVAKGVSFRWWIERIDHPGARFFGFDTFTGLPEDWGPFKAGDMSGGDAPPRIADNRHSFYQGVFQKTLYDFLKTYKGDGRRKVIHMDADLYTATLFVLTSITPYLKENDIIMFDEFNVPMHEYKAFKEWVDAFYIDYEVIAEVNNFYQTALKVKRGPFSPSPTAK